MNKFLNGFLNICLIVFIILLVLNQLYIIDFSLNLRNIFIFLTLIIILLTATTQILIGKSNFLKFISSVILITIILGGISCFCCFGTGIGVIPAAIALVFSIIAVAKGGKNAKKLGIIGLILSAIGLVLNAVILAYGIWMIRWDHMTIENLSSIQNLNPANEKDIIEWLQQFIKVDISGMVN